MIGGIWLLYVEDFNFSVDVGVGFIVFAGSLLKWALSC
jgi:Cu/Ag efflux pump CusA